MAKEMTKIEQLKDALHRANMKLREYEGKTRETIEEHPYESVAAAFGVGILAGVGLAYLMRKK